MPSNKPQPQEPKVPLSQAPKSQLQETKVPLSQAPKCQPQEPKVPLSQAPKIQPQESKVPLRQAPKASQPSAPRHRAGFVNIIGNPNVGKSTLMNALVGEKLSIVTAKAQTTRHRIMGIVNGDDYQIVYSDTPGILKPNYRLQQNMLDFVDTAIGDADIILYVTDTVEQAEKNAEYVEKLQRLECPVILVINKIDISTQEKVSSLMAFWQEKLPKATIYPASAQEKFNMDNIFDAILENLPLAPPWYDKDVFTVQNLRFFASEILREKIFLNYSDEIPYSVQVEIEQFKEGKDRYDISAVIYVMRDSQKGIIIGKGGAALKKVGTQARIEMEDFFQKKVFLSTLVKVDPDWRESSKELKKFGYEF